MQQFISVKDGWLVVEPGDDSIGHASAILPRSADDGAPEVWWTALPANQTTSFKGWNKALRASWRSRRCRGKCAERPGMARATRLSLHASQKHPSAKMRKDHTHSIKRE
jgi:hypothetical protein